VHKWWSLRTKITKKRLAIDYSETINRFTLLDGYPLPRIDDTVSKIAQYRVFSHGSLYQFTRVPFGVTNGVACFQRIMDCFIKDEGLEATFAYLDNVTVCGMTTEDHDNNLKQFLEAAEKKNIVYNESKCKLFPFLSFPLISSVHAIDSRSTTSIL